MNQAISTDGGKKHLESNIKKQKGTKTGRNEVRVD